MEEKAARSVGIIGGADGPTSFFIAGKRQYKRMYRDVYRYYGASQEDIDNKTKRYANLCKQLL